MSVLSFLPVEDIARLCHEANRGVQSITGEEVSPAWGQAPVWQLESAVDGVIAVLLNPDRPSSASHGNWMKHKEQDGWVYGPVKDAEKKEHPCMVPYEDLPPLQRVKDHVFTSIVQACANPVALELAQMHADAPEAARGAIEMRGRLVELNALSKWSAGGLAEIAYNAYKAAGGGLTLHAPEWNDPTATMEAARRRWTVAIETALAAPVNHNTLRRVTYEQVAPVETAPAETEAPGRVTLAEVEAVIEASELSFTRSGKTTVLHATLPSGFEILVSSACINPSDYDGTIGARICRDRLRETLWEMMGFVRSGGTGL